MHFSWSYFLPRFTMAEKTYYIVACVIVVFDLILAAIKSVSFDWSNYAALLLLTLVLVLVGNFYRNTGRSPNIAMALIATAGLIFFSASLSTFNYLLLPIANPTIDGFLNSIDQSLGVHWPDVMLWASEHPTINLILKFAYTTTLPQLAILILVLGFSGNQKRLDQLSLSLTVSGVLVVVFWGLFPTLGAKCMFELPAELWAKIQPVVDEAYALELLIIAREGVERISPDEIRGLIAFPSYHATLALMALYGARHIRFLFPIYLVLNLLILPATMIHGGHHFVDPFGGIMLFFLTIAIVWFVQRSGEKSRSENDDLQAKGILAPVSRSE